ncbi:related to sister chromatid cohesion and DNA repair () [Lecanosticta acicola]|uniref:Related to sister chromatid cohesion and DNA repair ( ) n=1 Tax=Lecanosticta acicola TaxID=111012 RepID=A0AAI8Z4R8_9PEZI|nr:related to sister chromatid cohesion and DNA repair () [Lecanosticta acicola]
MPRARRNKEPTPPAAEDVGEKEHEEQQDEEMEADGDEMLEFNEPLTWRPGKPIQVGVLLRRLETLCKELQSMDQETVNRESVTPKAQELASKLLLEHKDSGIKAWTMLCIVEVFRLLAPDAPYKPGQLKDIFTLFVSIIVPALANPSDPYNGQHLKALESLASYKSILLISDIPSSDRLTSDLFTHCFDVLAGGRGKGEEQLSKNVSFNMTGLLTALVDEGSGLAPGVIDVILAQFLRVDPSIFSQGKKGEPLESQVVREVSPAYNMAKSICNVCEDKMVRHIGQYFNSVLIDANEIVSTAKPHARKSHGKKRTRDESDDESDVGLPTPPSETDLEEVSKAHKLLRELWRSCPEVIRNVIPQLEAELGVEYLQLRTLAVETIGDMIAGVGAAGPPPSVPLDPAAYPSQSLEETPSPAPNNILLAPAAPHAFSSAYPTTYHAFLVRNRDKFAQVRGAWATAAGRILLTSGGGKGLDAEQETSIQRSIADLLIDADDKVRLAAVQAIARFDFHSVIKKLGNFGGVTSADSILYNIATRIKDPKVPVRTAAVELLAKLWGVAAGAIAEGRELVRELLGAIPTKLLEAVYINDRGINSLVMRALYESLLPVGYPPIKARGPANGDSQRVADSQGPELAAQDPDAIRVERLLILVRDLEEKAKTVFLSWEARQVMLAKYVEKILSSSEQLQANPDDTKAQHGLMTLVTAIAKDFPDTTVASAHLMHFAKHHDRRNFALVRFCINPENEYKKVVNALKELTKRLEQAPHHIASCLETVGLFLRMSSYLIYNRSHVSSIMAISRSDEKGLATAAHDVLKKMSTDTPQIFKVHIRELCDSLKQQAPSATTPNDANAVDSLKACAGFARRFPEELLQDRAFYQAMEKFANHGTPPRAAKHAVTVIVSAADKKEMYIKNLLKSCTKGFKAGQKDSLAKLATMAQLCLLASDHIEDQNDAITEIATGVISAKPSSTDDMDIDFKTDDDNELQGNVWALKLLVNTVRGRAASLPPDEELPESIKKLAGRVFRLLNTLVDHEGELSKSDKTTSEVQRAGLRTAAAKLILKLCRTKAVVRVFPPRDFNRLIRIAQDPLPEVRSGFISTLKKYLTAQSNTLPRRFYGLAFLYAFEPDKETKQSTVTFLKARAAQYVKTGDPILQSVFAYLLSLLAHHQDFGPSAEDLEDFVDYIIFYLKIVASEKNLPEIYSIAQRIKTVQDGIDPAKSENLYILSDLSEAIIRQFADIQGWSLQILPGRAKLPSGGLFTAMPSHTALQEVSEKRFLPEDFAEGLEDLVKERMRSKKRKAADGASNRATKKARTSGARTPKVEKVRKPAKLPKAAKAGKTPKRRADDAVPSSERRKSARASTSKSYVEMDDSEDDNEFEKWQEDVAEDIAEDTAEDEEANKENVGSSTPLATHENVESSTPPSSDPVPAPASVNKDKQKKESVPAPKKGGQKKASTATSRKAATTTKKPATRAGRSRAAKKDKDAFDVPSDTDEELSDAPEEVET